MRSTYSNAEREHWLRLKAQGRKSLVWREILGNLVLWLGISLIFPFMEKTHDLRTAIFTSLVMLPIFLLYAYLNAGWKWKDFQKKYPE